MSLVDQLPTEGALFKDVLRALIEDGIGPMRDVGTKWSQKDIVNACGLLDERTVRYWLSGAKLPDDNHDHLTRLERLFFGRDFLHRPALRVMFRNAFDMSKELRDGIVSYARFPTVPAFWDNVKTKLDNRPAVYSEFYAENIRQAAWVVENIDPGLRETEAIQIAEEARSRVFDDKYGDWKVEDDERYTLGIDLWTEEFLSLLTRIGVKMDSKVLVVGTGCGLEGVGVYDNFSELHGIDISTRAVQKAKIAFPNANIRVGQAEDIPKSYREFDAYISLKTYSSSFFDVELAVINASSVLRTRGVFICSIPRGYGYDGNEFKAGLMRINYRYNSEDDFSTYSYLDKQLPFDLISRIIRALNCSFFRNVKISTGHTEHYIIATRI